MTSSESPAVSSPPAISQRRTVSRSGAAIRLERLTLSRSVREAIARQFTRAREPHQAPSSPR